MTGLNKIITPREGAWGERDRILKAVDAWEGEEVRKSRGWALFFCPVCTRTEEVTYARLKKGVPKCPVHLVDMVRYEEGRFCQRRRELADLLRRRMDDVLELFERAAEAYIPIPGLRELRWRLENGGELVVKPGTEPTEFRYVPVTDSIETFFYYYSPQADKILEEGARRLGIKYRAEAMPNHVDRQPLGFMFSRVKGLYVKEV
jgi:hypothetical protein